MSSFSIVFARIFHHNPGNNAYIDRIRKETWVLSLVLVGISLLTGRALAPLSRTCDMFTTHPDFPQPRLVDLGFSLLSLTKERILI